MKRICLLLCASLMILPLFGASSNHSAEAKPIIQTFHLPDTPFLPPYTGRIVAGDVTSKAQPDGGIAYNITFETAEHPAQVINWYKSAFQNFAWSMESDGSASYRLSARHGKNVESNIYLLSPRKAGAKAQVQLYYRYEGHEI